MSAYTKIKTNLSDQESLVYGIEAMGFSPEIYEVAKTLSGYSGHKNPKANVIIPRAQLQKNKDFYMYCDLGFTKQPDGFQVQVNDMDEQRLPKFMEELKLNYNVGLAMKKARVAGVKNVARKEHVLNGKKHVQLVFA